MEFTINELALLISALECLRVTGTPLAAETLVDLLYDYTAELHERGTLGRDDYRLALAMCAKLRETDTAKIEGLISNRATWTCVAQGLFRFNDAPARAARSGGGCRVSRVGTEEVTSMML